MYRESAIIIPMEAASDWELLKKRARELFDYYCQVGINV